MDGFGSFLQNFDWYHLLIIPGLLVAFTIHELGHSITAYFLGDTTQVEKGNITANPLKHVSWMGATLFVLFGVGWPKPMQFNPRNFKDRYLDTLLVSLAGPVANLAMTVGVFLLGLGLLAALRSAHVIDGQQMNDIIFFTRTTDPAIFGATPSQNAILWLVVITNRVWMANFTLGIISLIPLPPFDGFSAVLSFMGVLRERRLSELTQDDPYPPALEPFIEPEVKPSKKQTIADIHFQKGLEYHRNHQFDDAIARYRLALKADPSFGPAYVNMGLAHKAKGQTKEAIYALRGATQYASDELSQNQAWAELRTLDAIPDMPNTLPPPSRAGTGVIPWTERTPTPNWIGLGVGLFALMMVFVCPLLLVMLNIVGS